MPKVNDSDAADKLPYRVPSMAEVAEVPWNGFTVASTFSGCGGSSLGYRMAGFKVLWASEFVEAARDSYRANMSPDTILDDRDIRQVNPAGILRACGLKKGQLDLLDGSPPCASFSTAGKRQAGWGQVKKYSDTEQRTDDLFFEYVRVLRGLMPKTFVAENVSGLVKGTAKGYFLEILKALKESGYRVSCRVLDAQWLGVPQQRQRAIFVGVRNDLVDGRGQPLQPCHPSPLPFRYSVREAIPWISGGKMATAGNLRHCEAGRRPIRDMKEPAPTVMATPEENIMEMEVSEDTFNEHHVTTDKPAPSIRAKKAGHLNVSLTSENPDGTKTNVSLDGPSPTVRAGSKNRNRTDQFYVEPEADISRYAIGREWDKIVPGCNDESKFFQLVKPKLGEACPTVTAEGGTSSLASVVHPVERRKFSIAELRRICAFPDDFVLTGSYAQQWERLGRAVPPLMMRAIAESVRDGILRKAKHA